MDKQLNEQGKKLVQDLVKAKVEISENIAKTKVILNRTQK